MTRNIQIVDLDGCIADDRWRRELIQPTGKDKFHEYHAVSHLDFPVNINEIVAPEVIVLTGRPVAYREQTLAWLGETAYVRPLHIIMRNNGDYSNAVILKERMVRGLLDWNSYGIAQEWLTLAIDDRADIVEMYQRVFQIPSKIVRIGDEEHING